MNLKATTIALMVALVYEMLLKSGHVLAPSLFAMSPASGITSVLSFLVGIVLILFVFTFHEEQRHNRRFRMLLEILVGCIVIHFILRLPAVERTIDFKTVRLLGAIMGFAKAVLLFALLISYRREVPPGERALMQATVLLTVMFGIGAVKSLYALIDFARFVIFGITVDHAPMFNSIVLTLFLITHAAIVYFLYRFYRFKFTPKPIDGLR